jgi:S1-C subfamily serine protease
MTGVSSQGNTGATAAIPAFPPTDLCALAPEGVILGAPQVRRSGALSVGKRLLALGSRLASGVQTLTLRGILSRVARCPLWPPTL